MENIEELGTEGIDNYGNKFSYDAVMELIMYNYKKRSYGPLNFFLKPEYVYIPLIMLIRIQSK